MIVFGAALIGALLGGFVAKKRGGSRLDIAQYAASSAIAFAVIGMVATVMIHRSMV